MTDFYSIIHVGDIRNFNVVLARNTPYFEINPSSQTVVIRDISFADTITTIHNKTNHFIVRNANGLETGFEISGYEFKFENCEFFADEITFLSIGKFTNCKFGKHVFINSSEVVLTNNYAIDTVFAIDCHGSTKVVKLNCSSLTVRRGSLSLENSNIKATGFHNNDSIEIHNTLITNLQPADAKKINIEISTVENMTLGGTNVCSFSTTDSKFKYVAIHGGDNLDIEFGKSTKIVRLELKNVSSKICCFKSRIDKIVSDMQNDRCKMQFKECKSISVELKDSSLSELIAEKTNFPHFELNNTIVNKLQLVGCNVDTTKIFGLQAKDVCLITETTFVNDVSLDESIFAEPLKIIKCKFQKSLCLDTASFKDEFNFYGSQINHKLVNRETLRIIKLTLRT